MLKNYYNLQVEAALIESGWKKIDSGSGRKSDNNKLFALFVKETKMWDISNPSHNEKAETSSVPTVSGMSQKIPMENNIGVGMFENSSNQFLNSLQDDSYSLIIRCDCFYDGIPDKLIQYHYSLIHNDIIYEFIFFPIDRCHNNKLRLNIMLGCILDYINFKRYNRERNLHYECITGITQSGSYQTKVYPTQSMASSKAKYYYHNNHKSHIAVNDIETQPSGYYKVKPVVKDADDISLNVTLMLNRGLCFMSSLCVNDEIFEYMMSAESNFLISNKNSLFSSRSYKCYVNSYHNNGYQYIYPLNISVRDVINHKPDEFKNPLLFCPVVNYPVSDHFSLSYILSNLEDMASFLDNNPSDYFEYSSINSVALLLYISSIYGINHKVPSTILSKTAEIAKSRLCDEFGWKNDKEFYINYSGMAMIKSCSKSGRYSSSYDPASPLIEDIHHTAASSYFGGYNSCHSVVLHKNYKTYDIDANNGYPTIIGMLPMINWGNPVAYTIYDRDLTLDDFRYITNNKNPENKEIYPMIPLFCNVDFEFPTGTKYPNIPVADKTSKENIGVYPLKGNNASCCGITLYTALKMGAKIHVHHGYVLNVVYDNAGNIVKGLFKTMQDLITERNIAIEEFGKKSLQDYLLKLIVNSLYGKISQGVKDFVNAILKGKDYQTENALTNPIYATMITSAMRSLVISACCEIESKGYTAYSVTTDGFITDCPLETLSSLPLMGIKDMFLDTRCQLLSDPTATIWSIKHEQSDLLNITTRGNVSINTGNEENGELAGVIACAGLSRPNPYLPKDSVENREAFREMVITRNGKLKDIVKKYPNLKDLQHHKKVFKPTIIETHRNINFDLKRKPLKESLVPAYAEYDGTEYEVAQLQTEPYTDVDEFNMYRMIGESFPCLRTMNEWNAFFKKVEKHKKGLLGYDDFEMLKQIIHFHKTRKRIIPALSTPGMSVAEKIDWINNHNQSGQIYTANHWKHASDPIPEKKQIPIEVLEQKIKEWFTT